MLWTGALLLTLLAATLFYLADREQRWLDRPLPMVARWLGVGLTVPAALLWVWSQGLGVGLMFWLWSQAAFLIVLALLAAHQHDSFQKGNRMSRGRS
ncbi:hypothetical protein Y5S_02072 [Alcanivorax nanhaiticus]|uniref:DUF3325 domain-containing protein n=1 Tax=Alcanivorax nanhaiticus TaxID=1177154 RepID=A0A095SJ75_9GAMM|nr:hypothetical protein [Alcanivorax nanhaiticus]KGD64706.1 hypothetical protein Y5S_02072 [Alcanivorax nanhaiticus]